MCLKNPLLSSLTGNTDTDLIRISAKNGQIREL